MTQPIKTISGHRLGQQLFISQTGALPTQLEFEEPSSFVPSKPRGGLWTSTYHGVGKLSGWWQNVRDNGRIWWQPEHGAKLWLLSPAHDQKLVQINDHIDLLALDREFGSSEGLSPLVADVLRTFDWCAISREYAGIHVTSRGVDRNSFPLFSPHLNGWDVESTLWLCWPKGEWSEMPWPRHAYAEPDDSPSHASFDLTLS